MTDVVRLTPRQLIGKVPWIKSRGIVGLKERCQALTGGSPVKAYRARSRVMRNVPEFGDTRLVDKHQCHNLARYEYRTHHNNPFWEKPRLVCWSHMVHHHLLGNMYEADRFDRWMRRNGHKYGWPQSPSQPYIDADVTTAVVEGMQS